MKLPVAEVMRETAAPTFKIWVFSLIPISCYHIQHRLCLQRLHLWLLRWS
jgi:hypothetical protein